MSTYKLAYVFTRWNKDDRAPRLVGSYRLENDCGMFRYDDEWLDSKQSFALDPVHLPLTPKTYESRNRFRTFSALMDNAPDRWGQKLLIARYGRPPVNPIELLLKAGGGVGCLAYSGSRATCLPYVPPKYSASELKDAIDACRRIEANEKPDPELVKLVKHGTSMGGARPKLTVLEDDGSEWLVKFNRIDDPLDIEGIEAACLMLAKHAGITVPEFKFERDNQGGTRLSLKRFDRDGDQFLHFVSAATLLYRSDEGNSIADLEGSHSYMGIAEVAMQICHTPLDQMHAIAHRMLFNAAIVNTDDHMKNHGFLLKGQGWELSPAYDLVPHFAGNQQAHAIGLGSQGAARTAANLVSDIYRFRVKPQQFSEMAGKVQASLAMAEKAAHVVDLDPLSRRTFLAVCRDGEVLMERVQDELKSAHKPRMKM